MALQSTTAIATLTLQQASSAVTFSGIPNTYKDLILTFECSKAGAERNTIVYLNGSASDMTRQYMYGAGSIAEAGTPNGLYNGFVAAEGVLNQITFFDYSSTDKHKTMLTRWDLPVRYTLAQVTRWAQTQAINSIAITPDAGEQFNAGSRFSLYGRIA